MKTHRCVQLALGFVVVMGLLLSSPIPSHAWWRGHGGVGHRVFAGPRVFVGPRVIIGAPVYGGPFLYAYPYYHSYYYPSVVVESPPQVYVQAQPPPQYWYYCQNPQGYYPYVQQCPGGWQQVVPSLPGQPR